MGEGTRRSLNLLSIVVFGALDALLLAILGSAPLVVLAIMILMLVGGVIVFAYSLMVLEKYREVFDYEATALWGLPSTGKAARSTLMAMNAVGLWSFLAGGILPLPLLRIF